ncbi:MAG: DUF547 domain-containing protein [Acidobacteria bacterium]|nr:DUF547 domain-containing protein [Acidobacteriota bacterium]
MLNRLFWALTMSLVMAGAYVLSRRTQSPQMQAEAGPGAAPRAVRESFDHSDFERLLEQYVDEEGWVDYAALKRERTELDAYIERLAAARPDSLAKDERLALYINAYNAFTLADALDTVYGKAVGVKEVSGFFNGKRHAFGGEELTLDEIESRGRNLGDPRIHFAVVCASTSCPKLQRFAYTGAQLDQQLDRATREFLADPARGLRVDAGRDRVYLSSIFKWYAGDFTGAQSGASRLLARTKAVVSGGEITGYVRAYAPPEAQLFLDAGSPGVHYLDYDWTLNSQENHEQAPR